MSYRDLLLEAEQTIQELEDKVKSLSLIDWKGLFETRVILLQKTEIRLKEAEARLDKALTTLCWCYGKHCHEWLECHNNCAAWSIKPISEFALKEEVKP
jgi:7-cyano-7-deazaguanine synthase in queuosine biosynthesis